MFLYLVQHAEAKRDDEDRARPISQKGLEDISKVAAYVSLLNISVSEILHSSKLRVEGERRPFIGEAVGQRLGRELLHDLDRLPLRIARRRRAIEFRRRIEVVARHAIRSGDVADGGEGAERHRLAGGIAHPQIENVAAAAAGTANRPAPGRGRCVRTG